jgi:hypothetical protein
VLVRFFRSSFPIQYLAAGIVALVIWATALPHPPPMPVPSGPVPFYRFFFDLLTTVPRLAVIAGFCVVTVSAFWLNRIVSSNELVPKNSSLTAFVFILMMSYAPSQLTLTPVNISVLLMLYLLQSLMISYNRKEPFDLVYAAGFFITVAALFYLPILILYGFLLTSFIVYRTPNWREWVSSLIGLLTPVLFLAVWYFWFDRTVAELGLFREYFSNISVQNPWNTPTTVIPASLVLVMSLVGLYHTVTHVSEKTVEIRKKIILLIWLVFWAILCIPLSGSLLVWHPGLLFLAFAPATSSFFLALRKPGRWEFLLWGFLLLVLVNSILAQIF